MAELLHDGEAFNFRFHSPLAEGKGGQANSSRFPMDTQAYSSSIAFRFTHTHTHRERQKHVLSYFHASMSLSAL